MVYPGHGNTAVNSLAPLQSRLLVVASYPYPQQYPSKIESRSTAAEEKRENIFSIRRTVFIIQDTREGTRRRQTNKERKAAQKPGVGQRNLLVGSACIVSNPAARGAGLGCSREGEACTPRNAELDAKLDDITTQQHIDIQPE